MSVTVVHQRYTSIFILWFVFYSGLAFSGKLSIEEKMTKDREYNHNITFEQSLSMGYTLCSCDKNEYTDGEFLKKIKFCHKYMGWRYYFTCGCIDHDGNNIPYYDLTERDCYYDYINILELYNIYPFLVNKSSFYLSKPIGQGALPKHGIRETWQVLASIFECDWVSKNEKNEALKNSREAHAYWLYETYFYAVGKSYSRFVSSLPKGHKSNNPTTSHQEMQVGEKKLFNDCCYPKYPIFCCCTSCTSTCASDEKFDLFDGHIVYSTQKNTLWLLDFLKNLSSKNEVSDSKTRKRELIKVLNKIEGIGNVDPHKLYAHFARYRLIRWLEGSYDKSVCETVFDSKYKISFVFQFKKTRGDVVHWDGQDVEGGCAYEGEVNHSAIIIASLFQYIYDQLNNLSLDEAGSAAALNTPDYLPHLRWFASSLLHALSLFYHSSVENDYNLAKKLIDAMKLKESTILKD